MIDLFKDRYKVGLMMASLFLVGILASLYQIYRLPHALMVNGYHPAFSDVYIVVGITFVIGAFTVWSALHYKDEVIVFRDKQTDQNLADKENDAAHQSEI